MSVIKGLKAYNVRKDEQEAKREAAAKPKFNRFNLEKDGDSAVVRFAQEVDYDAANYNADRGIGFVNIEHNHPDPHNGWKNRANCSKESQGDCYPCNRVGDYSVEWADRKGWKQKEKFYINLVAGTPREVEDSKTKKKRYFATDIDRKTGDGEVYLLEQGTYNGIWDALAAYALDEDSDETILNKYFKISRKGSSFNDTSYVLTPLKELGSDVKSLDEFELVDIEEDVLRDIPFAQQASFYNKGIAGFEEDTPVETQSNVPVGAGASATEDTW